MSGIYIHIPFCKQACNYCNFHFSTTLNLKDQIIESICKEIELRKDYLSLKNLDSIYFGGGTPSLLNEYELERILNQIAKYYTWDDKTEVTLEANPDDITKDKIEIFNKRGINRLSIGIQSFFDEDLVFMHRAHNAAEAHKCIQYCNDGGIHNLSIDLIYGSNTTTDEMWISNLNKANDLQLPHISSYCLTVEEKTVLHHQIASNKLLPLDSDKASNQFNILMQFMQQNGYDHYEISNFAKPGHHAVHNTNYWKGEMYLGIGPSAHSFNGESRSWNIANNKKYLDSLKSGNLPLETEILSQYEKYNEYIMTGLRTMWGIDINVISNFGDEYLIYFHKEIATQINHGNILQKDNQYLLTRKGKFYADRVASEMFMIE